MTAPRPLRVAVTREPGAADLPLPAYQSAGASGLDLRAAVQGRQLVAPGACLRVPTGLRIAVPEGYEAQVRPRSSLALRGLILPNAPGTIDSDYRGELQVVVMNTGAAPFAIERGDRIAQLVLAPVVRIRWDLVAELPISARGARGFGSTGER